MLSKSDGPDNVQDDVKWRARSRFGNDSILGSGANVAILGFGMGELLVEGGGDLEKRIALSRESLGPDNITNDPKVDRLGALCFTRGGLWLSCEVGYWCRCGESQADQERCDNCRLEVHCCN